MCRFRLEGAVSARAYGRSSPTVAILSAFTLVELLIVMAILSLLAAMLLPALGETLIQGRIAACSSQFRQMLVGTNLYADDADEHYPNLNAGGTPWFGGYLNLAVARPHSRDYWNNWSGSLQNGEFTRGFCKSYLQADWGNDLLRLAPTPQKARVPDLLVCPGLQRNSWYVHMVPPGGQDSARWQIGEHISYGGFFVGYGSFLGHYKGPANGQGNTWFLPRRKIQRASAEILLIDALICRPIAGAIIVGGDMTVPHGRGNMPKGVNQGFADGSIRFFALGKCNKAYQGAYPWDRHVFTPFYLPPGNQMLTTGWGNKSAWSAQPDWPKFPAGWYGIDAYIANFKW